MKRQIVVRNAARADLIDSYGHLAADNASAAERFLVEAAASFERLLEQPGMGRRLGGYGQPSEEVRVWRVRGFESWLIFYREIPTGIDIIRVLHGARDLAPLLDDMFG